jgi:hypothetical protein
MQANGIAAPLEIGLDPDRLVIGTDGVTIDATGSDSRSERRRHEAEIDSPAGAYGRAGVFAMARGDPCIDEPAEPIEAAESLREWTDHPVVLGRGPLEIEIAHQ